VLEHVSNLNVILQGKDLVHELYMTVQVFKGKLFLFSEQVTENKFTHFNTLQRIHVRCSAGSKYSNILSKLHEEFCRRFIQLLTCPFSFDVEKAPDNVQLEVTDLHSDNRLREKFNSVKFADFLFQIQQFQRLWKSDIINFYIHIQL